MAAKHPVLFGENGANTKKMEFIPSFHPKASPVMISDWDYTPTPEWGAPAKRALAGEKFPPPEKLR